MSIFEALIGVIAPHECLGCGAENLLLCPACARDLPPAVSNCYRCQAVGPNFQTCSRCAKTTPLGAVTAVTDYTGVAKELLWRLKFARAQAGAGDIARTMSLPQHTPKTLVVHIPTATSRVRQRGYDQARLLARHLAHRHGLRSVDALARLGQQRQLGTKRTQRQQQLQQAFYVRRPNLIKNQHIILIDDVLTTGATLEAAATVLKQAGAARVDAALFARA